MPFAANDLRAFCRDMGVPVSFQGAATYPDGQPVLGLFEAAAKDALFGASSVADTGFTLQLPSTAFTPLPRATDHLFVLSAPFAGEYVVRSVEPLDDGGMVEFALRQL